MAKTYTAKLSITFQKQHTCVGCESEFRYQLNRQVTATGASKEAAESNLQEAVSKSLANDVDQHACPHCGMMQPEMIALTRSSRAAAGTWIGFVLVVIGLVIALPHWVTLSTSAMVSTGGMIVLLLLWLSSIFYNPNSNMARGLAASEEKMAAGTVQLMTPGKTQDAVDEFSSPSSGQWSSLILAATSLILVGSPIFLPSIMGWKMNDCYPAVVGPGDQTTIYFAQQIRSLKGYWNGFVSASAKVEGSDQPVPVSGETKQSTWGSTISGKSVSNNTNTMWAKVRLPADVAYEGKTMTLDVAVNASFPVGEGREFFEHNERFQQSTTLQLSESGSGAQYFKAWLTGQISALACCIIGGLVLSSNSRSLAAKGITPRLITDDEESEMAE